jgi:hypothetical protein
MIAARSTIRDSAQVILRGHAPLWQHQNRVRRAV